MRGEHAVAEKYTPEQAILRAISERLPLVLLLGQSAWISSDGTDAVLTLALQRLGVGHGGESDWTKIISSATLPEDFYIWLAERFARRPEAEWLRSVAALPWSAVFTSSLDQSLSTALATSFREPQVILTSDEIPLAARSTARTPLYYLFGRAGISDQAAMPPRTRQEFRIRQNVHSVPLLNRLTETLTSLGLLIIDGINPEQDWLERDSLLAVIEQLQPAQVVWCGIADVAGLPEDYRQLVETGHIAVYPSRLANLVAELGTTGKLADYRILSDQPSVISFTEKSYTPTPDLRIRVEASASIVDDSWTAFEPPLGKESEYAAFRRFHGDTGGPRALVSGIRNGFAIVRDFEDDLCSKVSDAVNNHARYAVPFIVHGQSGTGKSIALARLVSSIREKRLGAVLYATARIPLSTEVEEFCSEAEVHGSAATVIICDTNASLNRYANLLSELRSRGRRVVLVGSTYRQVDLPGKPPETFLEAPEELSNGEREQLARLIRHFSGESAQVHVGTSRHVLVNMYRLLPASRARLAAGLSQEARTVEEQLRSRAISEASTAGARNGSLEDKLRAAGFESSDDRLLSSLVDTALQGLDDDAGRLIDYVMIPGQLGCSVPVEVLLRALNSEHRRTQLSRISELFKGLDLFRWKHGETSEDFLLSPRIILEAELICRRRMLNARTEGSRLVDLIKASRLRWDAGGTERRFLLDLLQKLGPDGPRKNYYKETYLLAGRALTELRTNFGVLDPSLMLQESVLRRSAIRENTVGGEAHSTVLEEARAAVQDALGLIEGKRGPGSVRTKSNLLVERATIFGYLATYQAGHSQSTDAIWSAYLAARTAARAAVGTNETYFPLDVSLWIPADLLKNAELPEKYRLELQADIHAVLDRIDPSSFPFDQQVQYNKRKYVLGQVLSEPELSETAFEDLKAQGITAGYFLRARSIGPNFQTDAPDDASAEDLEKAAGALAFLAQHWSVVLTDDRCLRYYLQCRWLIATRKRLFRGERAPLPFEEIDRRDLLSVVEALNAVEGTANDNGRRYLEAVLNWLLGNERAAVDIWRELSRESDFLDPHRVNRRHVLTDAQGIPMSFTGRIEAEADGGRYTLRVDQIDRRIQLLQRDFPNRELGYGRQVTGIAIAFNYIGPIADPPSKRGVGR